MTSSAHVTMNEDQFKLFNLVLVRHGGEMGVKSRKTRSRMINILNETIRAKTKKLKVDSVVHKHTRTLVSGMNMNPIETAQFISNSISGVDSTSPVQFIETNDHKKIIKTGVDYALTFLKSDSSFGFKVRRTGDHSFSSMELAKILGDQVINQLSENEIENVSIDLTNPDFFFQVEVKYDHCYYFHLKYPGINGLPRGSQGYILASIRPWIPDYLAACMMQRRGAAVVPIYFSTPMNGQISSSHNFFQNFVSGKDKKRAFTIDLEKDFLKEWNSILPQSHLCQACHFFTEKCCHYLYEMKDKYLGIVSGTSFRDISPVFLKELDSFPNIPFHRPNLLSIEDNVPIPFKFMIEEEINNKSCCAIQKKREYCNKNELSPEILKNIDELAKNIVLRLISLKT